MLAAFVVVGGYLGDCYGRRRVFVVGAAIFAATSVSCVSALGAGHLIAARAAQGPDGAFPGASVAGDRRGIFRGETVAKAIGAWGRSAARRWLWGRFG